MVVQGQRVLITGASSGIGKAMAVEFARAKADLVISARTESRLSALARELRDTYSVDVRVVTADLEQPGGGEVLGQAVDALGLRIDHLVNNAGFGGAKAFRDTDPAAVTAMLRLNCEALTTLTRHFLPPMMEHGHGGVLNVASMVGLFPVPFMAEYAATKAYVVSFTRALREELRGTQLRMSVLCPGAVPSGFQARAGYSLGVTEAGSALSPERVAAIALRGYLKNRAVIVPGATNQLSLALLRLVPTGLTAWATGLAMKRMGRI